MPKPMSNASGDPLIGDTYLVGDRRIALAQAGEGGPAVVFLPGAGLIGLSGLIGLNNATTRYASIITRYPFPLRASSSVYSTRRPVLASRPASSARTSLLSTWNTSACCRPFASV